MEAKKIIIVDDHTLLREGLRSLLISSGGFEVVGEAGDGMEAIQCIETQEPDLVLVDIAMPWFGGIQAIK